MNEFCTYCNDLHEFLDFGYDFKGNKTLLCSDKLSDALVKTMPKLDYEELENTTL